MGTPMWEGPEMRADRVPNTYIAEGEWPRATLTPEAPIGAHIAQEFARRLKQVMDSEGLIQRDVANRSELARDTIGRILRGATYPDLATIARLEHALRADLYPTGMYWRYLPAQPPAAAPPPPPDDPTP